jgi:hypothetical protein
MTDTTLTGTTLAGIDAVGLEALAAAAVADPSVGHKTLRTRTVCDGGFRNLIHVRSLEPMVVDEPCALLGGEPSRVGGEVVRRSGGGRGDPVDADPGQLPLRLGDLRGAPGCRSARPDDAATGSDDRGPTTERVRSGEPGRDRPRLRFGRGGRGRESGSPR